MAALVYSFSLFVIWTVVGRALAVVSAPRFGALRPWLLAPGLGLAVFLLGLMALNQFGWPIAQFARPMTLVLGLGGLGILAWKRPPFPRRALKPFFAAAVFSLVWTGWPGLQAGFNWISYGNDDMANYCLAAERFAAHGFFAVPTMAELSGRDYSTYYFFMHVADMMRFGAEHIVAWSASLAGLKATQAFMPAILALSLAQLFAAGALALQLNRHRRRALVTVWVLAVSPLFMLGTLYQLIAQVAGITLLLLILALLARTWGAVRRPTVIRYAILPAVAAAALCITYPEPTPFLALAYFAFLAVAIARRRLTPAVAVGLMAYTILGVVLLLRYNVISFVSVLVMQLGSATHQANLLLSLFPYFLLPTGFPNLFGWMPIARDFAEPVVTLSIVAGMALAAVLLWRAAREAWQLGAAALLLLVEAAVAVQLYRGGTDFPLYKLAMWMQPTIAVALAGLVLRLRSRRRIALAIAVFGLTTAPTALHYTRSSQGTIAGGMTELRYASRLGMDIRTPAHFRDQITATVENVVAAKFAAAELRGHQLALASRDYFFPNTRIDFRDPPLHVIVHPHFDEMAAARPRMVERNSTLIKTSMLWHTEFTQPVLTRPTDYYLSLADQLSLFNKFGLDPATPIRSVFELTPASEVRNYLMFVHSGRGNHYYLGDRRFISFFQQEADPFLPGGNFNGLGRFMLLRVENPTDEIYLRIAATRTGLPGRTEWNHAAKVHGTSDQPLGVVGHGAFNLFVGPLRPQRFEDAHYVAIDFAEISQVILDRRSGLKALYNRFVPLDYRRVIGWARDISALSPEEYRNLRRPLRVARFPEDVAMAEALEFSGIYEDGWLSPESKFVLGAPPAGAFVHLRGFVPDLPGSPLGTGTLELSLGQEQYRLPAAVGWFDWLVPMPAGPDARVGLRFTATTKLPDGDERPTGAKLEVLEVVPGLPSHTFNYGTPGAPRLASSGIDQDGWMARAAAIHLPPFATRTTVSIDVEFPGIPGWTPGPIRVEAGDGARVVEQTLAPGHNTLRIAVPASTAPRTLRLEAAAAFRLAAPDNRERACRILDVQLGPEA